MISSSELEPDNAGTLRRIAVRTHQWQRCALVVIDEVSGLLPPHPANSPTKQPIVAVVKQARAFGVGVLVATRRTRWTSIAAAH